MRKFSVLSLVLFGALSVSQTLFAQRWSKSTDAPINVYSFTETVNTAPELVQIFYSTQGEYFRDPRAPRFVLTDREGKWGLGIGGYVMARAEYDFGGITNNIDFLPSAIRRKSGPQNQIQMDITTSTVFLKLVGRSRLFGDFVVYTSGDWRGNGNTFHLLNAYMSNKYVTFGYTTGSFMDLAAYPATVDNAGPCGMTFYRTTQLAVRYAFDWGLSMGIAVEAPNVNVSENEFTSVGAQELPDIPIYIKYQFYKNTHLRVAAIMRDITYRDLVNNNNKHEVAWGAQASALVTIGDFQLSGQYTIGEGIGTLINDVSNLGIDLVPTPGKQGTMMRPLTDAWFASVHYNINPMMFVSATYSQTNIHSCNGLGESAPTMYKRGQYLAANMFVNASHNLQLGIEYLHGWRVDFNNKVFNSNRVNLAARYNF